MTPPADAPPHHDDAFETLAAEVLRDLTHRFPVCLHSDEFHFFPQSAIDETQPPWDDFSPEAVAESIRRLRDWALQIRRLAARGVSRPARIEAAMLDRVLTTLCEQFEAVRSHETQPSFHLTVIAIGLADALASDTGLWRRRIAALPAFLDRAAAGMTRVPALFRDLGCEMVPRLTAWLRDLDGEGTPGIAAAGAALEAFGRRIAQLPTVPEFRLAPDLYARVAARHIGCRLDTADIAARLDAEIATTRELLVTESKRRGAGTNWPAAYAALAVPSENAHAVYHETIAALSAHCRELGLVDDRMRDECPVVIRPVPDHLRPVRSTAAYGMTPGHPPRGGCFYTGDPQETVPPDWRQLCAHETYPGHHLLDNRRWDHPRPLRRHIEFPLFYEGWASFSEEMLFDTGFFAGAADRLCMAKRRFWRALRGRAELDLQAGRRTVRQVAGRFTGEGLEPARAEARVRRYALKPGYQLCYTLGRGRFRELYDRHVGRGRSPADFARTVFAQGEIGLDALDRVLLDADGKTPGLSFTTVVRQNR